MELWQSQLVGSAGRSLGMKGERDGRLDSPPPQNNTGRWDESPCFCRDFGFFATLRSVEIQNCSQFNDYLFLKVYESESLSCTLRNVHHLYCTDT